MSPKILIYFVAIALLLVNWSATQGCTQRRSKEQVKIIATAISPNKEYVATVYVISGGGAAGYVYNVVNLRKRADRFDPKKGVVFSGTRIPEISLTWDNNEQVTVKHSKSGNIYTQAKQGGDRGQIRINYVGN